MCLLSVTICATSPQFAVRTTTRHRRFPPLEIANIHDIDCSKHRPRQKLILSPMRSYAYALSHDVLTFCTFVTHFSQPRWSRRVSPLMPPPNRCLCERHSAHIPDTNRSPRIHRAQSSNYHESRAIHNALSRAVLTFWRTSTTFSLSQPDDPFFTSEH